MNLHLHSTQRLAFGAGLVCCAYLMIALLSSAQAEDDAIPRDWIDPATGHRVVRLSTEAGTKSLYFHQYPFSADGQWMVMTTPRGIAAVNLQTREVKSLVEGRVRMLMTGKRTGDAYYLDDGVVRAVSLVTGESRTVTRLPHAYRRSALAVNADETLLVGVTRDPAGEARPKRIPPRAAGGSLARGWAAGSARMIFTIDLNSDKLTVIHRGNDWINHLQCSPTDPHLMLFCHEGPWHLVDRSWLLHTDGTNLTLVHPRTMDMEIAGHEFFSADGSTVWYDLQTPRSLVFWLAGYDHHTGQRTWYHLPREQWSVHYNISPDGTLFAGDGGGPNSVANRSPNYKALDGANGQWIYLFRPRPLVPTGLPGPPGARIKAGTLIAERLVDLSTHNYKLEPNVIFTPDGKWVVFRSNMHGPAHTYAVSVAAEQPSP